MLKIHELLNIFGDLKPENKEVLYNFLVDPRTYNDKNEIKEFRQILKEMKSDLLYYDEEFDNIKNNEQNLCFTVQDLAIMTDQPISVIKEVIEENNIKPVNPCKEPLFYDIKEFNNYYFMLNDVDNKKENLKEKFMSLLTKKGDYKIVKIKDIRNMSREEYEYWVDHIEEIYCDPLIIAGFKEIGEITYFFDLKNEETISTAEADYESIGDERIEPWDEQDDSKFDLWIELIENYRKKEEIK